MAQNAARHPLAYLSDEEQIVFSRVVFEAASEFTGELIRRKKKKVEEFRRM